MSLSALKGGLGEQPPERRRGQGAGGETLDSRLDALPSTLEGGGMGGGDCGGIDPDSGAHRATSEASFRFPLGPQFG